MKKAFRLVLGLSFMMALTGAHCNSAHAAEKPIEFRLGVLMSITTLDPAQVMGTTTFEVSPNLYDTLIFPDQEKGYVPWIAESWKISQDVMKYTFYLKKGIPFHDGTEITAEDVAFSMDRLLSLKESTVGPYFSFLRPGATKVVDRYTVEFNLTQKAPDFMVTLFLFKIVNKKVILKNKAEGPYGEFGDYGVKYLLTHDAGSGPFIAVEHRVGDYLKMKRFEDYPFTQWRPNSIDTATFLTIPEAVTRVTKLKAGELDMSEWTLPTKSLQELQKNPDITVSEEYTMGYWSCHMNTAKPPLDDPYVRKACAHAWDTAVVTNSILAGGKPGRGPVPEILRGGCSNIADYPYDLKKAEELLNKSKYSAEELEEVRAGYARRRERTIHEYLSYVL